MQIQIVSKNIDVSAALRERITDRLEDMMDKYIHRSGEAHIAVARDGSGFKTTASVHLPSGATMQGQGTAGDAYGATDESLEHLEKRLRRYKRRLKDHQADKKSEAMAMMVLENPIAPGSEEGDHDDIDIPDEPLVVAETKAEIQTLSVSRAALELGLTDNGAIVFYNTRHGGLNVVFKRADGNIGWIDPKPDKR